MRKFLPALFSGLLAVSFSQLAAAQSSSTQTPDNRTSADTGIKSESGTTAGAGASTSTDRSAASGASSSEPKPVTGKKKGDKMHRKAQSSSAGGTSAGATTNEMPRKPDASAAPNKSDSDVRSGAKSPTKSEKSD